MNGGCRGKMMMKETETKHRKHCSHGGCTNFAQKGGVCVIFLFTTNSIYTK
jgi:hypothetical protein